MASVKNDDGQRQGYLGSKKAFFSLLSVSVGFFFLAGHKTLTNTPNKISLKKAPKKRNLNGC